MTEKNEIIAQYLRNFAALTDKDIAEGQAFWKPRKIAKGDFFNMQSMVCNDLGLVVKGIFRIYYRDPKTEEEKNLFFFSENQFVVSFRSFISQNPCWYFIEAMEDSEVVFISYQDLNGLYERNRIGENSEGCWRNYSLHTHRVEPRSLCSFLMRNDSSGYWKNIRISSIVFPLIIFLHFSASPIRH